MNEIGCDVKEITREVKQLNETNQALNSENKGILLRLEEVEHYQTTSNVEMKGVALENDPVDVVKNLKTLSVGLSHSRKSRLPQGSSTATKRENIVVRFVKRMKRDAFWAKAKKDSA